MVLAVVSTVDSKPEQNGWSAVSFGFCLMSVKATKCQFKSLELFFHKHGCCNRVLDFSPLKKLIARFRAALVFLSA